MIMAGVGQLLDRDTALLFFGSNLEANLEYPSQTARFNEQYSFLKCRALAASSSVSSCESTSSSCNNLGAYEMRNGRSWTRNETAMRLR